MLLGAGNSSRCPRLHIGTTTTLPYTLLFRMWQIYLLVSILTTFLLHDRPLVSLTYKNQAASLAKKPHYLVNWRDTTLALPALKRRAASSRDSPVETPSRTECGEVVTRYVTPGPWSCMVFSCNTRRGGAANHELGAMDASER